MLSNRIGAATLVAVVAFATSVTPSASGAVTVGETFTPNLGCGSPNLSLQTASPGGLYSAPSSGVLTSWSFQAAAVANSPTGLKFKVARPLGGNDFRAIGESVREPITPSALNTFPIRIPVEAGDVIGYFNDTGAAHCVRNAPAPYSTRFVNSDLLPGSTATFMTVGLLQIDIAALLEPDADGDSFGDETQDDCPTDGGAQGPCPPDTDPPQTKITKGAPNKTDETKLKFKFTSSEPGSTFECKLDKKKFKACTSPRKVKHLDGGKHKFKVIATDAAGNTDPTAAKDKFKVVG